MGTCQPLGGHVTNMVGGAPHQQINTRASGQSSLHVDVKDASQLDEPGSQTSQNLQDGKEQVTRQTNLYMQDGKDDEVQYETDEEEFDDENLPSTGGPCHQYGGGGAPPTNKYPGTWPIQPP